MLRHVKATEQYFPVVLLIMLYKVVLNLESVDELLKCVRQVTATYHEFSAYSRLSERERASELSEIDTQMQQLVQRFACSRVKND